MTKRYTPEEKQEFNRRFLDDFLADLTVEEIAEKHGVSKASIYRWKREQNQDIVQLDVFKNFGIDIEDAFNIVHRHDIADRWTLRDALFRIAIWIRWPTEPHIQRAMLITCICNYLRQHCPSPNLHKLDENERKFLYKYVDLDFLGSIATPNAPYFDFFNIQSHGKARYSDLDFFGAVTKYMLSPLAVRGSSNKYIQLAEVHYLIQNEVFGPTWVMSKRTFEYIWAKRAATFPFLFVERHNKPEYKVDWNFEPQSPEFHQEFDDIFENVAHVKRYLAHCRWATETLRSRLHPRTLKHIRFPNFPDGLASIALPTEPFDAAETAKLKRVGTDFFKAKSGT
ncbi:transposase [Methylobacterium sp. E-065]|uniref:transposase n=1 Tax=Methylobacterium sp. E-065 TaxID=2836583 RepID=UPI001FBAC192|nr:transposase [Methylobacterium sp. E-065]MCJ2020130.1 transposase [Methylobacterium sp. E-065]